MDDHAKEEWRGLNDLFCDECAHKARQQERDSFSLSVSNISDILDQKSEGEAQGSREVELRPASAVKEANQESGGEDVRGIYSNAKNNSTLR